ncbi:MAG: trypsin-like peptidase domain-containing protein [Oscillospiraceae bacterium]|nr:trypsin-like peptidase domain-containing protein [Oscillospiraceae bacterium]
MNSFDDKSFDTTPKNPTGEFAAGNDGEYHYIRPEATRRAYSDASFIPTESAGAVPQNYHCQEHKQKKKKRAREKRRGMPAVAVIALCLVCAMLGGICGGAFAGNYITKHTELSLPTETAPLHTPDSSLLLPSNPTNEIPDAGTAISDTGNLALKDIYALACQQVVAVTTEVTYKNFFGYTTSSAVSGSGFIISPDGYILTNFHVIEDAAKGGYEISVLTHDGSEYIASIVGYEADNDVAVLKIAAENLSAVTIGNSDEMYVGDSVFAVGNPLGELEYTMTGGMVSALDRDISTYDSATGSYTTINMFQIDAAVNSGNSGGPVYNAKGQVIGIVTAKYSNTGVEGLGFAVPINDAVKIAEDLIIKGYVGGKAYFGIRTETLPASVRQYYNLPAGAYVVSVESGSCAEKAGLEAGDIITAIDGKPISSSDALLAAKKDYRAGDEAILTVSRSDGDIQISIVFDEEIPSHAQNSSHPHSGIPGFGG